MGCLNRDGDEEPSAPVKEWEDTSVPWDEDSLSLKILIFKKWHPSMQESRSMTHKQFGKLLMKAENLKEHKVNLGKN